jgi:hypothetical protein
MHRCPWCGEPCACDEQPIQVGDCLHDCGGERERRTCPRCEDDDCEPSDIVDGRCGECRLHEDEAGWSDEADGPLN